MNNIDEIIKYSQNLKLLYVEDNQEARESTVAILEEFFYNIVIGIDGLDGYEKFEQDQNSIDIIITDINMPKLNGLEMIDKIRKLNKDIPVLIFSAHNETDFFTNAIKLGVDGYLLKPIDVNQFMKVLSKSVENINLKRENLRYKNFLEQEVQLQVERLREKDKMLIQSSKMAVMGEMIDAIAHQWKQPINIINMQVEMIGYDFKDGFMNQTYIDKFQEKVSYQVEHMKNTLYEFRDFFRPNQNISQLNLNVLFDSIKLLIKDELVRNNVELKILSQHDIFISASQNEIKHLFLNLINNAKDEMVKNNTDIENRIITIKCSEENNKVIISVKDNGCGIPNNIIDDIFKPNFTTKQNEGGTGIGLYMCKQIVDKYNGSIDVKNDNGAVFKIKLGANDE